MKSIYDVVGAFLSVVECPTMFPQEEALFLCQEHAHIINEAYPRKYALCAIVAFKLQAKCCLCQKELSDPSKEEFDRYIYQIDAGRIMHFCQYISNQRINDTVYFIVSEQLEEGPIHLFTIITAPIGCFIPSFRVDSPKGRSLLEKK